MISIGGGFNGLFSRQIHLLLNRALGPPPRLNYTVSFFVNYKTQLNTFRVAIPLTAVLMLPIRFERICRLNR